MEAELDSFLTSSEVEESLMKRDLAFFAERVLNMEISEHHEEWSSLASNEERFKRIGLNAPRDHGKSFMFCFAYAIWRAYYKWIPKLGPEFKSIPRISLGYIFSNTQDQAIKHLELIKNELETNPKLEWLLPKKKEVWSKQEIRLSNDAIIRARGWGVGIRGAHPCLTYNSKIVTEHGVKPIGDLVGTKTKVLTGVGTWKDAIFWSNGNKKISKLSIGNKFSRDKTELFLTDNHQVRLERGWVESGFVREGDTLKIALSKHSEIFELMGWMWNDGGCNNGQHRICFNVEKDGEAKSKFEKYFTKNPKESDCRWRVSSFHVPKNIGEGYKKKNKLKDNPTLLNSEEELSWLRGMMSANGSVIRTVQIKLARRELIEYIQGLFDKYNISTCPIQEDNGQYLLTVHKKSINQYLSLVGFIQTYKFEKARDLAFKVYKCEQLEVEEEVFDFKIIDPSCEDEMSAIVDGVIVHNCWIVCDDVLSEENIYSELTRKKEKNYLFSAVTPMCIPNGQIVVVGTPMHQDDLYAELERNEKYFFKKYPAFDDNEDALWPNRYSAEMLKERRDEVGSTRFAREYMCVPIDDGSSLFPMETLKHCIDHEYSMPTYMTREERSEVQLYTGIDLALSSKVGADYTVITTIAVDEHRNYWLVDVRRFKGRSMTEQLREIEDVYRNWRPLKMYIENNAFQKVFHDELVRRTDLPVEGYTTTRYNKNSLENGVPSLQILFENRKFILPYKKDRDKKITDLLCGELQSFSWVDGKLQGLGVHDDMVMSLFLAKECASSSSFSFSFA